jgi:hypothetical protein
MAITDRTYLVAGSLGNRLNESLPHQTVVLETDLDHEREGVHVRVIVGKVSLYAFVEDKMITSYIDRSVPMGDDRYNSPTKYLTVTAYMGDTTWAQFVCDYLTSEVSYLLQVITRDMDFRPIVATVHDLPLPTINDLVKSQAESEQTGFSLA